MSISICICKLNFVCTCVYATSRCVLADDVSTPIVSPVIRPYSGDSVKSIFLRKYTFGTQKLMKNKSLLDEIPVEFLT